MARLKKQKYNFPYRLGLDLGTNSIGWTILGLDEESRPNRIERMGVRIFSDGRSPKDKTSLAVNRREKRGARRRRDRLLKRKRNLLKLLVSFGLMPKELEARKKLASEDPYRFRAQAISEPIPPFSLGRALFHLNQRRGFKSNRKVEVKKEDENIVKEVEGLTSEMAKKNAKTLGEFFYSRVQNKEGSVRARPGGLPRPTRDLYLKEFSLIRDVQKPHHNLTDSQWSKLEDCIFFQRPLRKPKVGWCQLFPNEEKRCPQALPSFQKFRLLQDINNLRIVGTAGARPLDQKMREAIFEKMKHSKTSEFSSLKKICKLKPAEFFNLESEKKTKLLGDSTSAELSKDIFFGDKWFDLTDEEQDRIAEIVIFEENSEVVKKYATTQWGLDEERAQALADLNETKFAKGYARFSQKALLLLLPHMRKGLGYSDAVSAIGLHHSDWDEDDIRDFLPYYGEALPRVVGFWPDTGNEMERLHGRIGNPTVHIALNQLRKVLNRLIEVYGRPCEVVVEVARDLKLTRQAKMDLDSEQTKNQKNNDRIAKELEKLGIENSYDNRTKFKLWEELSCNPNDRRTIFSGQQIGPTKLFSSDVEIEHILPWARTLDDSFGNKTLATREENAAKGKRSPFEAFGHREDYKDIVERAQSLPFGKRRKFAADAMKRFEEDADGKGGFLARHLNDTHYLAKVARQYVALVCPARNVWVSPGRLTAKVRHLLGLNLLLGDTGEKNRADHRHHALDALVIGTMDRKILKSLTEVHLGRKNKEGLRLPVWEGFREDARKHIEKITVSHRPEHGENGALHEDTAYGVVDPPVVMVFGKKKKEFNLVRRKPLPSLSAKEVSSIRDFTLRETILEKTSKEKISDAELKKVLAEVPNVQNVRLLKTDQSVKIIRHPKNNPKFYKAVSPGENHHLQFWILPKGASLREEAKEKFITFKKNPSLVVRGVSFFDLKCGKAELEKPHPAAKLKYKIHKGDLARIKQNGKERVVRIKSLSPVNRKILFVDHFTGGEGETGNAVGNTAAFAGLEKIEFSQLFVDPIGTVYEMKR